MKAEDIITISVLMIMLIFAIYLFLHKKGII